MPGPFDPRGRYPAPSQRQASRPMGRTGIPHMGAEEMNEVAQNIVAEENRTRELRRHEKGLRDRERVLSTQPAVGSGSPLADNLKSFLPGHLVPSNVGNLNTVTWPFWFVTDHDFGSITSITDTTQNRQNFQVSQESGFLLMAISRTGNTQTASGQKGPWTVEIRDRQSSRQFNDKPIPFQMIGSRSCPTLLPTPLLIMPNAFVDVIMATWLSPGVTQAVTPGEMKFQFAFHGQRVRVEDADRVLDSIFAR